MAVDRKEIIRSAKFVAFSISAGVIEIGVFTLLNEVIQLPYWGSYLTGLICSVLWNFTFNRRFTFKSTANVPRAMFMVFCYYLVFTPLSTLNEHWLAGILDWNEYIVTGINMLINLVTEYLFQRYVVYRKSVDSRVKE